MAHYIQIQLTDKTMSCIHNFHFFFNRNRHGLRLREFCFKPFTKKRDSYYKNYLRLGKM